MTHLLFVPGRCRFCLAPLDTSSALCPTCSSSWTYVPALYQSGPDGRWFLADPGWSGPTHLLPERYNGVGHGRRS